jgi:hypothetical protein
VTEVIGTRTMAAGAAASLFGLASPAVAGVVTLEPAFSSSAEYETNPLLRSTQPESGAAIVANVGLPVQWDDGARHAEFAPRARLAKANGDSPIGANGYYLDTLVDVPTERSDLSASLRWGDDSSAIREPAAGTLIRTDLRERVIDAAASWQEALTDRTRGTLGVSWRSLNYAETQKAAAYGLYSYRYGTASAQLSDAWTERTRLEMIGQASRYELLGGPTQQYTYSLQAGLAGSLSKIWNYKLLLGESLLAETGGVRDRGTVYVASIARQGLRSTWSASVTKSIQPSGYGTLLQSVQAAADFHWSATERVEFFVTGRASKDRSSFEAFSLANHTYGSLAVGSSVLASETWTVTGQFNWRQLTSTATDVESATSAHGYQVLLTAERRFGRTRLP